MWLDLVKLFFKLMCWIIRHPHNFYTLTQFLYSFYVWTSKGTSDTCHLGSGLVPWGCEFQLYQCCSVFLWLNNILSCLAISWRESRWFHLFVTVNWAAGHIGNANNFLIFWFHVPRKEIARLCGRSACGFLRNIQSHFRTVGTSFRSHQPCIRSSRYSKPRQHLLFSYVCFTLRVTVGVTWGLLVVYTCISLMASDSNHFSGAWYSFVFHPLTNFCW